MLCLCSYITLPLYALVTQVYLHVFVSLYTIHAVDDNKHTCTHTHADGFKDEKSDLWRANKQGSKELAHGCEKEAKGGEARKVQCRICWWKPRCFIFSRTPFWAYTSPFQNHRPFHPLPVVRGSRSWMSPMLSCLLSCPKQPASLWEWIMLITNNYKNMNILRKKPTPVKKLNSLSNLVILWKNHHIAYNHIFIFYCLIYI